MLKRVCRLLIPPISTTCQRTQPWQHLKWKNCNYRNWILLVVARFTARYRLNLVEGIISLVVTYWASDVEMHTYLINYDSNMNRIDQMPISYDEIAEGYMQKHARITDANNIIVVSENRVSGELLRTETKYKCLQDGTFVENK